MKQHNYIGTSPKRGEDEGLVRGGHRYVADLKVDACLEACFVRSYEAHGELRSVDVSAAVEVEGVVGAYAAADVPELPDVPVGAADFPAEMGRPSLARGRVRFAGEPVAVVIAKSRYAAEDGAELIMADIESLEAVIDPTRAAEPAAPQLFEGVGNVAATREAGTPVDDVMASAAHVIETTIRNGRVSPTSIEARAILVVPHENGRLTVWVSHQAPQRLRNELAKALEVDPEQVRVIVPKVGGAFGAKSQTFPEYIVVAHLARKLERPVRWVEDRREALQGSTHGRGQNQRLRLAADREGKMLAVEALIDADVGAYPHTGTLVPSMTGWVLSGPYKIPRIHARVRAVTTNATPTASYRGAGRPEAAFALERLVDKLALRLGRDPASVRLDNYIPPEDFPYSSPTGAVYDSGNYVSALRDALELAGYEQLRAEQAQRRSAGSGKLLGIGIASYVERSGGRKGTKEFGGIEVTGDGTIVARSGSTPQGQGHETVFAQIVASAFDVEMGRVRVVQGDTDEVPVGVGTFGSRSTQVGGSALHQASTQVLDEARRRAGRALEVAEEDLTYASGRFTVAGTDRSVELGELAADVALEASLEASPPQAFPFGTYVCVVEVDRETGEVEVRKLVAVDDCGVTINPKSVAGQIRGSIVQGLGQALYEGLAYDDFGQPLFSSLMDYSLPTMSEVPEIVVGDSVTPNPNVPLGTKGAGEAGCIGTPPAVVNAVVDALEGRDTGLEMPLLPEKVWRALSSQAS
jgi:carbon-monoxide dehydrogenase large subunit